MSVRARFVHLGIHCAGPVPIAELEKVFSTALDWLRYDAHCWILYTTTEVNIWRDRILKIPAMAAGEFFLCEIRAIPENGYDGWMKKTTWEWIQKDRSS
jgi:hypothetical protein